jgi:hypothetical protein
VHRTVSTNVLGTRNILAAARTGTRQVVLSSTGKALRPYSPEIYAASKRAAEWLAATAAAESDMLCSAARFTHVIDNSIFHSRMREWAADSTQVARLHNADIVFYVQSAAESAQLLLLAMLGAEPGEFRVHAITDLGLPVSLLDIAIGVLLDTRSTTPVYVSGYDPGYEEVSFPGLYDPATAGDVSPLLNAFEAVAAAAAPCPKIDSFWLEMGSCPAAPRLLGVLEKTCEQTRDPRIVRQALDDLSWSVLDAALAAADLEALSRSVRLARRHEQDMSPVHRRMMQAIRTHADQP